MDRSELKTVTAAVTAAEATIGTVVPNNMRRYIYKIKFINTINAANLFTLGKRENGAGATTTIDQIQTAVQHQMETDPDVLYEDSAPLYIIEGPASSDAITPVGTSLVRGACSGAGTGFITLWYVDTPA